MALQLITGIAGSGKSTCAYDMVSKMAADDRDKNVFVLVPDQFSQAAQRILTDKNGGAILNIDVLSFHRLAYRALEEAGGYNKKILTDEGKVMLLRKVIGENKNELSVFTKGLDRPGFLDECKSLFSEFTEYGIYSDDFDKIIESIADDNRLVMKLSDIKLLYEKMGEKMGEVYRTSEDLIPVLTELVPSLSFLSEAVVCLDGFTGFTPVQYDLIVALMNRCREVIVTVTTDRSNNRRDVFALSDHTIKKLTELATENKIPVKDIIVCGEGKEHNSYRLKNNNLLDHIERNVFSFSHEKYSDKDLSSLNLRVCRSEVEESLFTAREIGRLIKDNVDPDDIAILTAKPDSYEPHLIRYLDMLKIPYFIDRKKSLGTNPLADYIIQFLEMANRRWDASSVVSFLRGGLSPVSADETDILENYMLASGRQGLTAFKTTWTYSVDPERMPLDVVNDAREKLLNAVEEAVDKLKGGNKKVSEFATIICELLIREKLYERLNETADRFDEQGEILMAKEYRRLYPAMMNVMDSLVELLGDEEVSLNMFTDILRAGITESVVGFVPPTGHQVVIGDLTRTRLGEVKYLFFLGNSDDNFPAGNGSTGLLSERDRSKISAAGITLAPSAEELYEQELFYMYKLLTTPSERLYLTYGRFSGSETVRPSYLIDRLKKVLPESFMVNDDDIDRKPVYYNKRRQGIQIDKSSESLDENTAAALYGDTISASVTRFEKYMKCPYAHFLNYGLGLKERDIYEVGASDRGSVLHDALKLLSAKLQKEGSGWKRATKEEVLKWGEEAFDTVTDSYRDSIYNTDSRIAYAGKRMKRVFVDAVSALYYQMEQGGFEQIGNEISFPCKTDEMILDPPEITGLPGGHTIRLHGRIDRLDICIKNNERLIKIVDYKSSVKKLPLPLVYHGLELQLFTYLKVAMTYKNNENDSTENIPAAVLFQPIAEKEEKWESSNDNDSGYDNMVIKNLRPEGLVNESENVLTSIDIGLSEGGFKSKAVPVGLKTDGDFDNHSKVVTNEQLELLMDHTMGRIKACGTGIYKGVINARPYRWASENSSRKDNGCDYCPYASACGLEDKTKEQNSHVFKYEKDNEILDRLESGDVEYGEERF